jgi:hypothetical protein
MHLCTVFTHKHFFVVLSRPRKNDVLGQAHSLAIEPGLKIAPLAGLFRPSRCGRKQRLYQLPVASNTRPTLPTVNSL